MVNGAGKIAHHDNQSKSDYQATTPTYNVLFLNIVAYLP
jgi:hypothetical protein